MDRLSIGAGLMMEFGNISLNRALVGPGEMSKMAGQIVAANPALRALIPEEMKAIIAKYDDASAASVQLKGDAGIRFGFNVGAMYDINEKFTVGVSYRSKVTAKVKEGNIALDYTNETELKGLLEKVNKLMQAMGKEGLEIPPLDKGTFSAE